MDTSEYDSKIEALSKDVENKRELIEGIVSEFIEATGSYASSFTKDKVNEYVKTQPEVTKNLEKKDLIKLKSSCRALINRFPEIAQGELNKDNIWEHRALLTAKNVYSDTHIWDSDVKQKLEFPIQKILGYSGELLINSGYKNKDRFNTHEWHNDYTGLIFKYAGYSPEMEKILGKYVMAYKEFNNVVYSLRSVETEKEQAEAADLWDQIE